MVATVRCEEIAHTLFTDFEASAEWKALLAGAASAGALGATLNDIAEDIVKEYSAQTSSFDHKVRPKPTTNSTTN